MHSLYTSLCLSLLLASAQASVLTFTPGTASDIANKLFGASYTLGAVTSAGAADQVGYFSGGDAAGFGIDNGIVLSSGTLTGASDARLGNADPDIPKSRDAASISTTIKAKSDNPHALSTFGVVFCTCEDVADTSFAEHARVVVNGKIVYDTGKGPEDTRPTSQFGFAVGQTVGFHSKPCKCSDAKSFTLARSAVEESIKVVVADTDDQAFNSWIFLGFTGYADEVDITATEVKTTSVTSTAIATATISTQVNVVTTSQTDTITQVTALPPSTVVTTAATSTSTSINPKCTIYQLSFEEGCCPQELARKKLSFKKLKARQQASTTITSVVATSTSFVISSLVATSTLNVVYTTSTTSIKLLTDTATSTFTPSAITSTIKPVATTSICKHIIVPKYKCPKGLRSPKLLSTAEQTFLNYYAKDIKLSWPLEITCDGDAQQYLYP